MNGASVAKRQRSAPLAGSSAMRVAILGGERVALDDLDRSRNVDAAVVGGANGRNDRSVHALEGGIRRTVVRLAPGGVGTTVAAGDTSASGVLAGRASARRARHRSAPLAASTA